MDSLPLFCCVKKLFIFAYKKPLFNRLSRFLSSIVQLKWGDMLQDEAFLLFFRHTRKAERRPQAPPARNAPITVIARNGVTKQSFCMHTVEIAALRSQVTERETPPSLRATSPCRRGSRKRSAAKASTVKERCSEGADGLWKL